MSHTFVSYPMTVATCSRVWQVAAGSVGLPLLLGGSPKRSWAFESGTLVSRRVIAELSEDPGEKRSPVHEHTSRVTEARTALDWELPKERNGVSFIPALWTSLEEKPGKHWVE